VVDHGKVIALGTPSELIASLGAEHVVEFALTQEHASVAIDELRALDGVRSARAMMGGYEMQVSALHRAVPALLTFLAERNLELARLTTHSASLEDVFVSLTGRQLRDE
jgi:ABC-2 type transport system ATP-binding protein